MALIKQPVILELLQGFDSLQVLIFRRNFLHAPHKTSDFDSLRFFYSVLFIFLAVFVQVAISMIKGTFCNFVHSLKCLQQLESTIVILFIHSGSFLYEIILYTKVLRSKESVYSGIRHWDIVTQALSCLVVSKLQHTVSIAFLFFLGGRQKCK